MNSKGWDTLVHFLRIKKINFIKAWHTDRKHNVEKYEAEEVFWNYPIYKMSKIVTNDRRRYLAYGETDEGRLLVVVYEIENVNEVTIITAREMEQEEKRYYYKNRRDM